MSLRRYITVAAFAGFNVTAASAATDPAGARECAGIEADVQRLACYDRAFGRTPISTETMGAGDTSDKAAGAAAAAPSPSGVDQARRREDDFGLSDQEKRARAEDRAEPKPLDSISATVKSVSRRPTGEQLFYLDDGQVWMEVEAYARTRVKAGEVVTIRRGALGSYMLVTTSRVATHVRRLK